MVILGFAGSGKTTLVGGFGRWLCEEQGLRIASVNLDPGASALPYAPDFDIRELFTLEEVMEREGLGPNGALVRCSELMEERASEIARRISDLDADYILIDTPGQMEIFLFRTSGPAILSRLDRAPSVGLLLLDPSLISSLSGLATAYALSLIASLRLDMPSFPILNKIDLPEASRIRSFLAEKSCLLEELSKERGVAAELAGRFLKASLEFELPTRLVCISALSALGFDELYDLIRESLCACGDLT